MVKYSGSYELAFFNENLHSSRKHPKSDSYVGEELSSKKMPKKTLYVGDEVSFPKCQKEFLRGWWSLCFFSLKSLWNYSCYSIPDVVCMLPHVRLFPKPSWGHVLEENGSFSKVSSSCLMHVSISPSACVIAIQNARASNLLESSGSHAWRSKLQQIFHHEWKKCPSMHALAITHVFILISSKHQNNCKKFGLVLGVFKNCFQNREQK